jgi:hypothetical protein
MKPLLRIVTWMAIAVAVAGCEGSPYYVSDPIEAWVVDAETGKPIEGAIVTANWQLLSFGFDTGGRKLYQLEVMETVTDAKGRFFFPGFTKLNPALADLGDDDPKIRIFKPGYEYSGMSSNYRNHPGLKSAHRHSKADAHTFRLRKESDPRKYAHAIDMLNTDLSALVERGYQKEIPRMSLALNCEMRQIKRIDPTIILSVPPMTAAEIHCEE